jgi:hypothetical protein
MKPSATSAVVKPLPRKVRKKKMAKKHLTCADSGCGYYWQDEDDDYPRCHFDGYGKAPCEEDDWDEE